MGAPDMGKEIPGVSFMTAGSGGVDGAVKKRPPVETKVPASKLGGSEGTFPSSQLNNASVQEKVIGPTPQEIDAANAGKYAKTSKRAERVGKSKLGRSIAIGAGIFGGVGVVGAGVYEALNNFKDIPAISRPAETAAPTLTPQENPFPFPLNSSSFATITQDEEKSLWENTKTVDLENHTFTIGFPVDQDTINKSPNLRYNSYLDPSMYGGGVDTDALEKKGIKSVTQITGLPRNASIYYKYDSSKFDASIIAITIAGTESDESAYAYTTLRIILRNKQTGKTSAQNLSVLYGKPLVQPAPYPKDYRPRYEDGTPIKPNEPITQLTTDLQDWNGKGKILPGQRGQVMLTDIAGGLDPQTSQPIFLSTEFLKDANSHIVTSK